MHIIQCQQINPPTHLHSWSQKHTQPSTNPSRSQVGDSRILLGGTLRGYPYHSSYASCLVLCFGFGSLLDHTPTSLWIWPTEWQVWSSWPWQAGGPCARLMFVDFSPCLKFFYRSWPPKGLPRTPACQRYVNQYCFAKLYIYPGWDLSFSTYVFTLAAGKRPSPHWKFEPQVKVFFCLFFKCNWGVWYTALYISCFYSVIIQLLCNISLYCIL